MRALSVTRCLFLAALVIGGTGGCATARTPEVCTLVGCEAGLAINVRGDRGGDISVKIMSSDGQMRSFECDADQSGCEAFFADYMPANVSVTVTKKESNVIRSYGLTYNNVYPNGEKCPPVCKQAHIDLVL